MKTTTILAVAGASTALAQTSQAPPIAPTAPTSITILPEQIAQYALGLLSNSCRTTVEQLVNASSPLYSCLQIESVLPAITTNGSIIPYVDDYLADVCYSNPCSTATLNATANQIVESCASDLKMIGVDNRTVYDIVGLYPLAREVACLKTTEPQSSVGSISTGSSSYNTTNGTFCITDLATELSTYLGANLTNAYIDTVALGANSTALQLLSNISATELCNECIFAALDLVESEYPQVGNYSLGKNKTINQWLEGTCSGFDISGNGTLPSNITEAAVNSTFPETVIAGNATYTPESDVVPAPTADSAAMGALQTAAGMTSSGSASAAKRTVGSMDEKKRWVGEW